MPPRFGPTDNPGGVMTPWVLVPVILGTLIGLAHIGHWGWTDPDEIIHAVVATNLTEHWLKPTLHEVVLGKTSYHWAYTHVWLHKPILPLWMSAASIEVLGNTPFAFRLPSLFLQQCTVVLIHLIGAKLYDRRTGLLAACLASVLPFSYSLLFGAQFCDIYDIGIAFWTALGTYLFVVGMDSGKLWPFAGLGVATGLAYHTKWEMGLLPLGLVAAFAVLKGVPWRDSTPWGGPIAGELSLSATLSGFGWRHVLLGFGTAAVVIVPWMTYLATRFPIELSLEHGVILNHLDHDVEGWSRPWYEHLWPYLEFQYTAPYAVVIYLAVAVILVRLLVAPSFSDLLCLVSVGGVFVPLSLAVSKVPAGTHIAYPILAVVVARAAGLAWSRLGWARFLLIPAGLLVLSAPVRQTLSLLSSPYMAPVPVAPISWEIAGSPEFDDAYFLVESDIVDAKTGWFLLDHFQLSFFTGHGAHRLEGDQEMEELAWELEELGYRPLLISTEPWPELSVVLELEGSPYTVYDPF